MSQENVEKVVGVRTPIAVSVGPSRRTLDEQLLVRFPALVRVLGFVHARLPPSSRLRRAWSARISRRMADAFNRRDFDAVLPFIDPEIEFEGAESLVGGYVVPDMSPVLHGREAYLRWFQDLVEVWDELTLQPEEVIDLGDRVFGASRIKGQGRRSGVALDITLFQVATQRNGVIVRLREFAERESALEAAGLSE